MEGMRGGRGEKTIGRQNENKYDSVQRTYHPRMRLLEKVNTRDPIDRQILVGRERLPINGKVKAV